MYAKVYAIAAFVGAVAAGESSAKPMSSMHHGNGTAVTTTKVVTAYTTYCPKPTTICIGEKTYTVDKPTTLTITDCPCTIVETSHHGGQVTQHPVNPAPAPPGPAPTQGNVQPGPPAPNPGPGPGPNTEANNKPTGPPAPGPAPTKPAVVVAGAEGRPIAYSFAMAAAGVVGYLAL